MSDANEEEQKRLCSLVRQALGGLIEHFDCVQIFACVHNEEGTRYIPMGAGNWYARKGVVSEWLEREIEESRESVRMIMRDEEE